MNTGTFGPRALVKQGYQMNLILSQKSECEQRKRHLQVMRIENDHCMSETRQSIIDAMPAGNPMVSVV